MNAIELADELDEAADYLKSEKVFAWRERAAATMLRQQQAKLEKLQELNREYTALHMRQQAEIEALKDFAIWMTGCGYDFCQHEYFIKCRDELLVGKAQEK